MIGVKENFLNAVQSVPGVLERWEEQTGVLCGVIAYGEEKILYPVARALATAAEKTLDFIKRNWRPMIAYLFAWGVIIACTGLMYGFKAVALPLTIGMSCGLVFGIFTGILTLKAYDPTGKVTLWNLINQGVERLDPNGTRPIVLSVAVTVILAASVVFPYVIGALFGILVGNQLATKAGSDRDLGRDPNREKAEKQIYKEKIEAMETRVLEYEKRFEKVERTDLKSKITRDIGQMKDILRKMHQALETHYPDDNPAPPLQP